MPLKDKTGPNGEGPKTGRGLGDCSDDELEKIDKDAKKEADKIIRSGRRRLKHRPMDGSGPNPGKGVGMGGTPQHRNWR